MEWGLLFCPRQEAFSLIVKQERQMSAESCFAVSGKSADSLSGQQRVKRVQ
jgi:hypothetical protein